MAGQNYNVNSNEKKIEVFGSYGGGMNSQAHPEKLRDDQAILVENGDLIAGGVVQARGGYAQTNSPSSAIAGATQGYFRYVNSDGSFKEIVAIAGKLYIVTGNTYTNLVITNLASFQTTRPIEAVQDNSKMYFATGSGVVVYDGTTAALLTAYAPNGLEALYIGTNGLAQNPDSYLSDTTGASNSILGVAPSTRYGVINQWVTFTAYVQKIADDTLEYQFETKRSDELNYTVMQVWGTGKTFSTSFPNKADYMVRVSARKQGTTLVLSQYILPRFRVNTTADENPEPSVNFDVLKTCNRIFIHYDRLWIYGATTNPDMLFCSHLNKFDYIPRTNTIKITDPLRGPLETVKRYKDMLVCQTDGSIQKVEGKTPQEFVKSPVHTSIGTKFPYSVQIMRNYIVFVGNDYGVYILKSFSYASDDKLNVDRIDESVQDVLTGLLKTATKVLSAIYNNQYCLYIENSGGNYIYRYYYNEGTWVRDTMPFNLATMDVIDNTLILTSSTGGIVYKLKNNVFKDGVNLSYILNVKSKDYNFGVPHHRKKLKQYQILAKMSNLTSIDVDVFIDNTRLLPQPYIQLGSTPLTFDTGIGTYTAGQTYTINVSSGSQSAWDALNAHAGDYISMNGDPSSKFLTILAINGYTLTVRAEQSVNDGTPATWSGERVCRIVTSILKYDTNQNTDAQKLKVMASGRFRYVKVNITIPVNELVQLTGFGFIYKLNTPK